ncbi:DUF4124 domain-containing protein [Nitrosomonas sp.]|uniref:DUF4124 domain-containing protein n=1 Tax=Nitrosomonas sp. TaxID=42353 RepID=UPI00261C46D4|nr:DUF4124 domain-containing protein [Nitrosomonas sp.]MCW5602264.1 DUF4124 domain-containing protein [Nitrosomonas sp.]
MRNLMFLVLLFLFVSAAHGQIYKWVDQQGKTQYTDYPPPPGASKHEKMIAMPAWSPSTHEDSAERAAFEEEQIDKERQAMREATRSKQLVEANVKKENCLRAQSNLDLLKHTERLSVPDGDGGVMDVDDELRQKYMDEALKNIAAYCD